MNLQAMVRQTGNLDLDQATMRLQRGENLSRTDAASFLDALNDEELEAAVAHELGHVWIFTHHPFLQTEELANKIAMRAVTRETLQRVYAKVWERGGTKGDLAWFLGDAPSGSTAGLASDTTR